MTVFYHEINSEQVKDNETWYCIINISICVYIYTGLCNMCTYVYIWLNPTKQLKQCKYISNYISYHRSQVVKENKHLMYIYIHIFVCIYKYVYIYIYIHNVTNEISYILYSGFIGKLALYVWLTYLTCTFRSSTTLLTN